MIINISLLQLTMEQENKLETAAEQHQRMSNIKFKVISVDKAVIIRTTQGENISQNYYDQKTLITRTKELFGTVITTKPIHVHAVVFNQTTL